MGIQGVKPILRELAPSAIHEHPIDHYTSRIVVIDASVYVYQFLAAVRTQASPLTNANGETTSHLQGFFSRTIRLMEKGIKPIYVFEGKPPTLKGGELAKRKERKIQAQEELIRAREEGDTEAMEKLERRTVSMGKHHNEQIQRLLTLMGVPNFTAPSEAEAQCAEITKSGRAWAMASEDMDSLCFGTPRLITHLARANSGPNGQTPEQFDLESILASLEMSMEQFIEFCILCGCDYSVRIPGIGPKTALKLLRQYGNTEAVVDFLRQKPKQEIPDPVDFPYHEAKELFLHPEIISASDIPPFEWRRPDTEGLVEFLVTENQFNEERVRAAVARLQRAMKRASQRRIESFFQIGPRTAARGPAAQSPLSKKRARKR